MEKRLWELSTPQKEILQFELEEDCGCMNNICEIYDLKKNITEQQIQGALNKLIKQEQALRLCFCIKNGIYYQYEMPYEKQQFKVCDWTNKTQEEQKRLCTEIAEIRFEVLNHQLYSFKIIKTKKNFEILFLIHHLIADGYSMGLLGRHLESLLKMDEKQEIVHRYTDFVEVEEKEKESERYQRDIKYWREEFANFTEPAFVCPEKIKGEEKGGARYERKFTKEEAMEFLTFCEAKKYSLVVPFAAALIIFMKRRNPRRQRIELGQMTLNRKSKLERETIGNYASELLLCVRVDERDTWKDLMTKVQTANREAFHHGLVLHNDVLAMVQEKHPEIETIGDLEFGYLPPIYQDGKNYPGDWIANETPETSVECNLFHMIQKDKVRIIWDYQLNVMSPEEARDSVEEIMESIFNCIRNPLKKIEEMT